MFSDSTNERKWLLLTVNISNKKITQHYKRERRKTNQGNLATFSWDFSVYDIKHAKRKSLSYPISISYFIGSFFQMEENLGCKRYLWKNWLGRELCVCVCVCVRERERETETDKDRDWDREAENDREERIWDRFASMKWRATKNQVIFWLEFYFFFFNQNVISFGSI